MKTPWQYLKKAAFAALLPALAVVARANFAPVATDPLADPDVTDIAWSATDSSGTAVATNDLFEIVGNDVVIDTGDCTLSYNPAASTPAPVSATVSLQFSAASTAPGDPPATAQTAITVFSSTDNGVTTTNYYIWAGTGSAGNNPTWVKITDANLVPATTTAPVDVSFVIDYAQGKVQYTIGNTNAGEYFLATSGSTAMTALNFQGTGTLTGSIATKARGDYELLDSGTGTSTYYATKADLDAAYTQAGGGTVSIWSYNSTSGQWESTAATYSVALSWPTGLTAVSYTVDGVAGSALTFADGSASITVPYGAEVELSGYIGSSSYAKTDSATVVDGTSSLSLPAVGIAYFFPRTDTAGQDGSAQNPFEIADIDDLQALQAAVAAGYGANLGYEQTQNIDMTSAGTFPGIGGDFTGTYDGGNKTISNIKFSASNYRGLFNQVTGATIKNLTIDTVTFDQDATKEVAGAAFVGKSYGNSTYSNLVAKGSIGTAANPCNHNTAGIIARIYSGSPTIVDCANEADIYCGFSKIGGICAIIQSATKATFIRCSNSGTITVPATYVNLDNSSTVDCGKDGVAGIIAYANTACDFEDCVNTGTISCANVKTDGNKASIGQIIGKCGNVTITDLGGNTGSVSTPMIGVQAGTINGFQFAAVDSNANTATTVAPSYTLADGETYLLERNVAAGTVHTLEAVGETIAFDTSLGYTFGGSVDGATGLTVVDDAGTPVVTYTALGAPTVAVALTDWTYGDQANTPAVTYNGSAYTGTPTFSYSADGQNFVSAVPTDAGTYTVKAEVPAAGNYIAGEATSTFTIGQKAVTITADNGSQTYNGNALQVATATATGLVSGHTLASVTCTGSQTAFGSSANVPSAATIEDGNGNDVTANYDITYANGTLVVSKATLTVKPQNVNIDHGALASGVTYPIDYNGLVNGETAAAVFTTEPTATSSYVTGDAVGQVFPITATGAVLASNNYSLSYDTATATVVSKTYNITFVDEDGSTVLLASAPYEWGTTAAAITLPATPTKNATTQYTYAFDAWVPALDTVVGDQTYTASYTETPVSYTLTWALDGGQITSTAGTYTESGSVAYGTAITAPSVDKTGYTFAGWTPAVATMPAANTTYTATWTANTDTPYTVEHYQQQLDGNYPGAPTDTDTLTGTTGGQTAATANTYTGFTAGTVTQDTIAADGSTVIRIEYTRNSYAITWLDGNGNALSSSPATFLYGDTPVYNGTTPTKTGTAQYSYTFKNSWSPAIDVVTGAQTYTAEFDQIVNKYRVRWFDGNGAVVETDNDVDYGTQPSYDQPSDPGKAADLTYTYNFYGWTNATVTTALADTALPTVQGDVDYYAAFENQYIDYTVTFNDYNGNQISTATYHYGDTVVVPANPTRAQTAQYTYSFNAWSPAVVSPVVGDAIYAATYTETTRQYTVTWHDIDGAYGHQLDSQLVNYGVRPVYAGVTNPPTRARTSPLWHWQFTGRWEDSYSQGNFYLDNALPVVTAQAKYIAEWRKVLDFAPKPLIVTNSVSPWTIHNYRTVLGNALTVKYALAGVEEFESEPDVTYDPTGTYNSENGTVTFAGLAWNQGTNWTITSSITEDEQTVTSELKGRAYAKSQTEWFTKAANALDDVTGFGDDITEGVAPAAASAAGQQVRINTRLDISDSGMDTVPAVGSARGGFAVLQLTGDTAPAYYAYTGDSTLGTEGWVKLSGAAPVAGEHDVLITVDTAENVAYYYIDGASLYIDGATKTYAIPVVSGTTVSAIGFANPDGVKSAVVGEYDVPYVAAIGTTGYTNATTAVEALSRNGENVLTVLGDLGGETIALTDGQSVKIASFSGTGLVEPTITVPSGYRRDQTTEEDVTTYTAVPDTATVIWLAEDGQTELDRQAVTIGQVPVYAGNAAGTNKADTAQYDYSFAGWNDGTNPTWSGALPAVTAGGATYTAVFGAVLQSYTITFTVRGETVLTVNAQDYGTATPNAPSVSDYVENGVIYTFTGWSPALAETVSGAVNYVAQFDEGVPAIATVITIADAGATTNTVGSYASLAAAVAAAQDGSTVVLLDNVTLDARVEPNLGANTTLTIDLNGKTITRTGTSGNGSAFDVKSGDVTIQNGAIDCTQDDTAIVADGVYAITSRSGSNVTLADLAITVNSECGACAYPFAGSTMTIESGTYANTTTTPYRYNTAITGMAVNQPNNATQNLFIKGGTFSQYDPQLGDDSGAMTDFTDDGFVAIDDGNGNWVVQPGYNVTFADEDGSVLETQRVPAGETPVYGGAAPAKASTDSAVYAFAGWTPAIVAAAADTTYTAQFSSIYLDPASFAINYNCYGTVSVSNAPAGATFFWTMYTNDVAFSSLNGPLPISSGKTTSTLKFYAASTPVTDGWAVVSITNGAEVITLKAPVTVKDVAAVVDGVEYAKADLDAAGAAALANGKTLGLYVNGPTITLAEGQTLVSQVLSERNTPTPSVKAPAGTAEKVYTVNTAIDNATKTRTYTLTYDTPTVMYTSTDGETVEYLDANFKMSKDGTYKLLKDVERAQLSVGKVTAVLDLNGHEFASTVSGSKGVIYVDSLIGNASLTIRDTAGGGSIVAENCYAIWGNRNATIAIEGGEIVGKNDVVYLSNAADTLTITGGTFRMASGSANFMLNMYDSARGTITVTGGSFQGFDPANNSAEGAGTSFLPATGYVSVADDPSSGWYTVYEAVTVSFVNEKGAAPADQVIGKGKTATAPAAPAAVTGYTFNGWFAPNAESAFDFATPVTADLTLTADWTINSHTLAITYVVPEGFTAPAAYSQDYDYDTAYSVSSPAVTGCTPDVATVTGTMGDEDVSVTVTYTANDVTVIWIVDGAETSETYQYGQTPSYKGETPTKAAGDNAIYTFTGWDPAPGTVTADATYTAQFKTWTKVAVPTAVENLVYDGTEKTGVASGTGYTLTGDKATNAGDYTATATLADAANTVWADDTTAPTANAAKSIAWSIAKATVAVPTAVANLTYDGTEQTGVAAGTGYTLSGTTVATAAGDYTATATLAANYDWSDETLTGPQTIDWSIAKATVAVAADPKTQVYGASAEELTYTAGDLFGSDEFSGALAREAGDAVGTYAINIGTLSAGDNYTISFTGANYTITAATVAVPTAATDLVYDGTEKTGVAAGTGYSLTGTTAATAAGDYTATATLDENYAWADENLSGPQTINWSIAKAAITVTAANAEKTVGDSDPAFSASITTGSLADGQAISYTFARAEGETAGDYTITPTATITASDVNVTANYDITVVTGTLTINAPAAATVISIALNTNAVGTVANGTLAATGVSGKAITVAADVEAQGEGTITVTPTPASGEVTVANDVATATFAADWNAGVEWTLAADGVAPLPGKSYLKAETQWFTTSVADLATAEGNIAPASASAEGQQVRIQTRITFGAQGSTSTPDVTLGVDRGGITVVNGAFKAYNGSEWVTLTGVTPSDDEVDLLMVADFENNSPTVRYYIDGKPLYMAVDGGTDVYAIPLASGNAYLTGVGFSDASAVGSAVTAEYDVPYVAAKVSTGYTTAADAVAAADKTGTDVLELLANVSGEIALTDGQSVQVKLNGFTGPTFTTSETGKQVVDTLDAETGVTTYALAAQTFLIKFVNYDDTVLQSDMLAYGTTPAYTNATPVKPEDAQYTYTFSGWDPATLATVTEAATYKAQFTATAKATGAVSGGVTILNTEDLTFTSIVVDGSTVTVTFEAGIVVAEGAKTDNLPFAVVYKTALDGEKITSANNAASVTLDAPVEGEYSTGTAVITLPSGVTNSFFLFGFDNGPAEVTEKP